MKVVLLSSLTIATLLPISTAIAADCYGGGGGTLEPMFRKEEAVRLTTELNSKIMNALDKVLLSTDASRANPPDITTNFGRNIKFVLDLQMDQENMDLLIERPPAITTAQQFIDTWFGLTTFFKYRKRYITNSILVDYKDINCLREVSLYGIGQSFGILSHLPGSEPPGAFAWSSVAHHVELRRLRQVHDYLEGNGCGSVPGAKVGAVYGVNLPP